MPAGTTDNTADSVTSGSSATPPASSGAAAPAAAAPSTPMTALQAVEKAAGSVSSTETAPGQPKPGDTTQATGTSTPGATPPATAVAPAAGQPGAPGTQGPIPFDRHTAAVNNARTEGADRVYRDLFGLQPGAQVSDAHRAEVKIGVELISDLRSNPRAFIENVAKDLKLQIVDPSKTPAPAQGQPPAARPKADLRTEDGRPAYSAAAVDGLVRFEVEAAVKAAVDELRGQIQPLADAHQQGQQRAAQEEQARTAREQGQALLNEMNERPHFKEHKAAILEKLKAMTPEVRRLYGGAQGALQAAYIQVLQEVVLPKLSTDAEERVRENYRKKANTEGGVIPGSGPSGEKKKPTNQRELAAHLETMMSGT